MTGDALASGVAPGPALSALLAGLDLPSLPDSAAVDVLRASWRQVSHAHAQYLVAMAEVGRRCEPAWAACEIEAALTFTGRRADYEHTFARTVVERLPLVLDARGPARSTTTRRGCSPITSPISPTSRSA